MKQLLILVLMLFMLWGCGGPEPDPVQTTAPTTAPTTEATVPTTEATVPTTEAREPALSWVQEAGLPWDAEGALKEMPLTVPNGLQYSQAAIFDGDLLLWSYDNHLADRSILELCLVELDDGSVTAQKDIAIGAMVYPQILGESVFLCDNTSGMILELDRELNTVNSWETEPNDSSWYMSPGGVLYIHDWSGTFVSRDLNTGEETPMLDGAAISYVSVSGSSATVEYYRLDTGSVAMAVLDLLTGQVQDLPEQESFMSVQYRGNTWLFGTYQNGYSYLLETDGNAVYAELGEGTLCFLDEDTLLRSSEAGRTLSLHTLDGKALASCLLTEGEGMNCRDMVWNEENQGYFCLTEDYDVGSQIRLLFWDVTQGQKGEDILFAPVPEDDQVQTMLEQKASELSQTYGVDILVGTQCDTEFGDFRVELATDWIEVSGALNTLEEALSTYPEGFFRQLRYGDIHSVQIQLVGTLEAVNSYDFPGTYAAFAQDLWDHSLIVADIYSTGTDTWYHEFSHLIDQYLEWDSWQREDALFSEKGWNDLNPYWFTGYSYQYGDEHELLDWDSFFDGYSTVKPTEDRARVMEYAMLEYDAFEGRNVLLEKLRYYCACIRDAFDTTGWPETTRWEQYT